MQFQWADAWLLHAVCTAGDGKATNLVNVIAAADFINHAIMTTTEIRGGVVRLVAGGHLVVRKAALRPRGAALKLWRNLTTKRRRIDTLQSAFEKLLAVEPAPHPPIHDIVAPDSWPSEAAVMEAYQEYRAMADTVSSHTASHPTASRLRRSPTGSRQSVR
jgi:hypothetical protein